MYSRYIFSSPFSRDVRWPFDFMDTCSYCSLKLNKNRIITSLSVEDNANETDFAYEMGFAYPQRKWCNFQFCGQQRVNVEVDD
jgi:hypothetical protein